MPGEEKLEDRILQKWDDIKSKGQREYLESIGIDVNNLDNLNEKLMESSNILIDELQEIHFKKAKETAEIQWALKDRMDRNLSEIVIMHIPECKIHDLSILFPIEEYYEIVPTTLSPEKANVKFLDDSTAQIFLDLHGNGPGTADVATIRAGFKFAFNPPINGRYLFHPRAFMNGWYLLWTWLTACEGGVAGKGNISVKLKIMVDQLSSTLKSTEHTVLERKYPSNSITKPEGAVDYVSDRDGGATISARLESGHEAVIMVECEVSGIMENAGRVIMDMFRSSDFYFKVPEVTVSRMWCFWDVIFEKNL